MENKFSQTAEKLNNEHRRSKRWHKVITVMAAVVVFCTTYALILPALTWERSLVCDMKEHTHNNACYTEVVQLAESQELVCAKAEHTHGDDCYDEIVRCVCGLDEDENHQHTADCMETERVLACEQEEHTHGGDCYRTVPAVTEHQLTCGKTEHVHSDACYDAPPAYDSGYYCGHVAHKHNENCYFDDGSLRCTVSEHEHNLKCQVNNSADVETAADWEATFADVELSGNWAEDVLAIADSQLGYTESTKNFVIDDEKSGVIRGYSRYGDWYGDPYGDWCAMFCAFCLDYAGVKDFPVDSNCGTWIEKLADSTPAQYHFANNGLENYTPQLGDLIFFDWDAEKQQTEQAIDAEHLTDAQLADATKDALQQAVEDVDHVGMVYELIPATDSTPAQIKTIEGNNGNVVAYHTYDLDDAKILGYGQLPKAYERVYYGDDYTVTATFDKDAGIPSDAVLKVEKIPHDSALYQQYYQQSVQAMLDQGYANTEEDLAISYLQFYDIGFYVDGKEIEPTAPVNIVISSNDDLDLHDGKSGTAIHFGADGTEILEAKTDVSIEDTSEKSFSFVQDSFSVTGVMLAAAPTTIYEQVTTLSVGDQVIIQAKNSTNKYLTNQVDPNDSNRLKLTDNQSDATVWTVEERASNVFVLKCGDNQYLTVTSDKVAIGDRNRAEPHYSTDGYWTLDNYNNQYHIRANNSYTNVRSDAATSQQSQWIISKAVSGGGTTGGDTPGGNVTKPSYPDYITPSDAKTGETNIGSVNGTYWSDAATSQLENLFDGVKADDGKVLTDKSVVYGKDDYGVFNAYDPNTFGVTLSALGQKYPITEEFDVDVPLDVVFVLDASGSMINTKYDGVTSANIMIEALNNIMGNVLKQNEDNRVGVVCFSGQATKLLDLGHYTATNDKFFTEGQCTSNTYQLTPSNSIRRTDGTLSKGTFTAGWYGTYTQHGIAMGAKEFLDNTDTTITKTVTKNTGEGNVTATYTATRRPIIILVSDGEPTYCTEDYASVLASAKVHGDGNSGYNNNNVKVNHDTNNNKGVMGYYTILSAQYYKKAISAHYNTDAYFYTIGIGINDSGNDSYATAVAGDDYKRTVLDPTNANVSHIRNCTNGRSRPVSGDNGDISGYTDITCRQLYNLLNDSQAGPITVGSHNASQSTQYGMPVSSTTNSVPVITNPYRSSGYSYANGSFFSADSSVEKLTEAFTEAISFSDKFPVYGYILRNNSPVEISDPIGEGMEIKSDLILRYGGQNYAPVSQSVNGNVTTYKYRGTYTATDGSGTVVDISKITAQVINENGKQTVKLLVPDAQLPTYAPNLQNDGSANFYYEALPVRLIYQVGLTPQAQDEISALATTGGTKTYYTNRYDSTDFADAGFTPTSKNPYYADNTYDKSTTQKNQNVTGTAPYSRAFSDTCDAGNVEQLLGNNGKLEFRVPLVSVTLRKVDMTDTVITTSPAQFKLYSNAELTELVGTYSTVKGELTMRDLHVGQGYWLTETKAPNGYNLLEGAQKFTVDASGKVNGIDSNAYFAWDNEQHVLLLRNSSGYELPESGGCGTYLFTFGGLLLMAVPVMYGYSMRRRRERVRRT